MNYLICSVGVRVNSIDRSEKRHHNIGLHHFALAVPDKAALEQLHGQLADVDGVEFELSPEALKGTDFNHMMCTIPGGLRVEFFALN